MLPREASRTLSVSYSEAVECVDDLVILFLCGLAFEEVIFHAALAVVLTSEDIEALLRPCT